MDIRHLTGRGSPVGQPPETGRGSSGRGTGSLPDSGRAPSGPSFREVLSRVGGLEFSGHAMQRLEDRSISMDTGDVERIKEAMGRAEAKGGQDSLILDGDQAFLVNIPNKTVVTAVDMVELREKVFTNIDSTVLTKR
ncbi:MAG: TIGR02530 family flagellar biosynthesis protein [Balneolaceae bacterium]|nr:TIGR02530 family flagellar biosynthesis protein [Balneolaceae bacterium]